MYTKIMRQRRKFGCVCFGVAVLIVVLTSPGVIWSAVLGAVSALIGSALDHWYNSRHPEQLNGSNDSP